MDPNIDLLDSRHPVVDSQQNNPELPQSHLLQDFAQNNDQLPEHQEEAPGGMKPPQSSKAIFNSKPTSIQQMLGENYMSTVAEVPAEREQHSVSQSIISRGSDLRLQREGSSLQIDALLRDNKLEVDSNTQQNATSNQAREADSLE